MVFSIGVFFKIKGIT